MNEVRSHYQSRCLSRFNSVKRKQLERLRQRSDWFLSPSVRERNNSRKGRAGEHPLFFSGSSSTSEGQGGYPHHDCDDTDGNAEQPGNNNGSGNGTQYHYHCNNGSSSNNNRNNHHHHHHNCNCKTLHQKNSGNPTPSSIVTKASSEGAVLDVFSDGDSVFTDNTSRSESPASEPVWSHILKAHSRDIIHSDTLGHLTLPELCFHDEGSSGFDLSMEASREELNLLPPPLSSDVLHHHDLHHCHATPHSSPSPSPIIAPHGYRSETEKGGEGAQNDDDDDDNTTPTGCQEEEEDVTLMASSLADINQQSTSEDGSSTVNEDLDKDSPSGIESLSLIECSSKMSANSFASTTSTVTFNKSTTTTTMQEQKNKCTNTYSSPSLTYPSSPPPILSDTEEKGGCNTVVSTSAGDGEKSLHQSSKQQDDVRSKGGIVKCFLVERNYGDDNDGNCEDGGNEGNKSDKKS